MIPLRIGIIGCGNISGIYFKNLSAYPATEIVAVADLDLSRAQAAAAEYGIGVAQTPEELLDNPDVDLVLNLTVPKAHADVALRAIRAGKHVYNEKPITIELSEAELLLAEAAQRGLRVGCAPDTFLGGGHQTCREIIDQGLIGEPVAANAFMLCRGHESWHPSPEFYYEVGGGPMLDMGPYYLTALVNMIGPIRRVTGSARATFPTRKITSQPKSGKVVEVETPTHLAATLDFANGAVVQLTTSFDVFPSALPSIVVYGSEGTLIVPDPNGFGGEISIRAAGTAEFEPYPLTHGFAENARGVGVLDIARAISTGRDHRASGALATHVLEAMHAVGKSSDEGRHVNLKTTVKKPAALGKTEL